MMARLMLVALAWSWANAVPAAEPARALRSSQDPLSSSAASAAPAASAPGPAPLEQLFSDRAEAPLRLLGYALFDQAARFPAPGTGATAATAGAVRDDYILGPGDELLVTFRGQRSSSRRLTIDRDGRLLVDDLRPLAAAGRSLRELRAALEAAVSAGLIETDVYLSLAEARRLTVLVAGEVARPGQVVLSPFATVLDALLAAGGVTRSGSLRRVTLRHAGAAEPEPEVDLYQVLVPGGRGTDPPLRDGDRIMVPPLGPTAAVAGLVKRPVIVELPPAGPALTRDQLLALGGGLLRPGANRMLRLRIGADGAEVTELVGEQAEAAIADGDLLLVTPQRERRQGEVRLEGRVHRPGPRALSETVSLSGLIGVDDPLQDAYRRFAALETRDPVTRGRHWVPLDLERVLAGDGADWPLDDGDLLVVLGQEEIEFLSSRAVLELLAAAARRPPGARLAQPVPTARPLAAPEGCAGLTLLARTLAADPEGALATGPLAQAASRMSAATLPCPRLFERYPDLLRFSLEHALLVDRGSERPGFYPRVVPAPAHTGRSRPAAAANQAGERRARSAVAASRPAAAVPPSPPGEDGVVPAAGDGAGRVELGGPLRYPGSRSLSEAPTLRRALLLAGAAQAELYPLFGVIDRFDPGSLARRLVPFVPLAVIGGRFDLALAERDRIRLFAPGELRALMARAAPDPLTSPRGPAAGRRGGGAGPMGERALPALLAGQAIQVRGAVLVPGAYPAGAPVSLDALLAAAGGLAPGADRSSIELTPADPALARTVLDLAQEGAPSHPVAPGDAVRVNPVELRLEAGAVTIQGEVRRPGAYDALRGEKLSSLIARAGGLTPQAFPAGTLFTRESARRAEAERYRRAADDIDRALALEALKGDGLRSDQVALAQRLAADLRSVAAVGRITVEADPVLLRLHPELDLLLEAGDRVVVPKRPLVVTVAGEVQAPAALRFDPGKTADDYLKEAGGLTRTADDDRAFVVLPDGSARPLAVSAWNFEPLPIPPGATIVVPRDPKPFDFLEVSKNLATLFGQLAIGAASLSVISSQK